MKRVPIIRGLSVVTLVALACAAGLTHSVIAQEFELVDLCDIAADPLSFHGRTVRLTVYMTVGFEYATLFDPECRDGTGQGVYSYRRSPRPTGDFEVLVDLLHLEDGRASEPKYALVTVDGAIHGPIPVEVSAPEDWPDVLRELFENRTYRYGHMDWAVFKLEISNVVSAIAADRSARRR